MKKKIRILHLLASNMYSGAENVVCTIISNMSDEYEFVYCSPKGTIEDTLKEKKIRYIPIKKLSYKELQRVINDFQPTIIHAHDNRATILASLFSNKYKVISHIHGNNKIMNTINLKTLLFNFCTKKISHMIWVSNSSLEGYIFNKKIKNKSTVLYNVIDKNSIIQKSKLYNCDENFDLIFLGRLGYPKNIARLLKIINSVVKLKKDLKVAIVGDGPDALYAKEYIENNKLYRNVKLFGFQSNPYPILLNSKVLIMTSIYEGTPMCALEAQALGKPIVSTPVDGLKKIIINDYNGFLSNDDSKLINAILNIINDKKLYNLYSNNSKLNFDKINKLDNYFKKIDKLYKEV